MKDKNTQSVENMVRQQLPSRWAKELSNKTIYSMAKELGFISQGGWVTKLGQTFAGGQVCRGG